MFLLVAVSWTLWLSHDVGMTIIIRFAKVPVLVDLYFAVKVLLPLVSPVTSNIFVTFVTVVVALPCSVIERESEAASVVAPETANDMNESVDPLLPVMSA